MSTWAANPDPLAHTDAFLDRHLGPRPADAEAMLAELGLASLDELMERAVPAAIRSDEALELPPPLTEHEVLGELRQLAERNQLFRSFIGLGYAGCVVPPVIQRNVLEDPGWYTQYTPYQAEIAQGRLEALLIFQTLVIELSGLEVANCSLLDEGTAAAEAMTLCLRAAEQANRRKRGGERRELPQRFFVSERCHPQTIAVVQSRAEPLGLEVVVGDPERYDPAAELVFGALVQYPDTRGRVVDHAAFTAAVHGVGGLVVVASDLLALTLLRPPGAWGADVVVGNSQRFGVPLGFGGPHAGFLATRQAYARQLAGRVVGVSRDVRGRPALRLALQTREQHIRRERATSNICTAQVLLAVTAAFYAVYHGPEGLRRIARRVRRLTETLAAALGELGHAVAEGVRFDTLKVTPQGGQAQVLERCQALRINLRSYADGDLGISLDEATTAADLALIVQAFGGSADWTPQAVEPAAYPAPHAREGELLTHESFHRYRSETELLRFIQRLKSRDLSLVHSMIPLGSCTMKLNATAEMVPITWPEFGGLHPFAPPAQTEGYRELFRRLETWLARITGFHAVSLQPNAGSQGEYAGLLVIRAYHRSRGEGHRKVCLIPTSAHGTNPASAVLAGMQVVAVRCDDQGNIDIEALRAKAEKHRDDLAALMVTYPSTHGVFETGIREICQVVHEHGGQVYLDGANMNAMVGVALPGQFGADVCHLNLHKTFCIPHGGGGPGMGPIAVAAHLAPFLPGHPLVEGVGGAEAIGAISAAPWGSPSILPISYAYIAMLGAAGLRRATEVAVLNANYLAKRLEPHFPVLYKGEHGLVAHECIIDLRPLKKSAKVDVDDVAKRLIDFGFHAPTMSWPVAGTLMIEPTESESKEELDRFCEALIAIRAEIRAVEEGQADAQDNPLKHAPHTADDLLGEWTRPYPREQGVFPAPWTRVFKFWPAVSRIDNVYGDRNLMCACPPMELYEAEPEQSAAPAS